MKQDTIDEATKRGDVVAVQRFLAHNADLLNKQDFMGWTPLIHAANGGHTAVVNLLLGRKGVLVNLSDKAGSPPLHWAAFHNQETVVRQLLAHKNTLIDLQSNWGWTALHLAARDGHEGIAHLLLKHGASPFLRDVNEKTPLDLITGEKTELRKLLLHYQQLGPHWTEVAFLAGQHHRAGAKSPIRELPTDTIREILDYLWPEKLTVAEPATQETEETTPESAVQEQPAAAPSIVEILQAEGIAGDYIQRLQHIQKTHIQLMESFDKLPKERKEAITANVQELDHEINGSITTCTDLLGQFYTFYMERNYPEQERIQQRLDGHYEMALNRLLMLSNSIKNQ